MSRGHTLEAGGTPRVREELYRRRRLDRRLRRCTPRLRGNPALAGYAGTGQYDGPACAGKGDSARVASGVAPGQPRVCGKSWVETLLANLSVREARRWSERWCRECGRRNRSTLPPYSVARLVPLVRGGPAALGGISLRFIFAGGGFAAALR